MKSNLFISNIKIFSSFFLTFFLTFFLLNISHGFNNSSHENFVSLYNEVKREMIELEWEVAREKLLILRNEYSENLNILVDLIYVNSKLGDINSVQLLIDKLIKLYPNYQHYDYILYLKGTIYLHRKQDFLHKIIGKVKPLEDSLMYFSRNAFNELITNFPNSLYFKKSKEHIKYLNNMLAYKELCISKFYFRKKVYIAAINRSEKIINEFPDSVYVKEANKIIQKSHKILKILK